jgi:hypothetical protein
MHKKEFWILTIKCGSKLKHENEAEGPWPIFAYYIGITVDACIKPVFH